VTIAKAAPEQLGFDARRIERLRNALQACVDDGRVPGLSFLLARHGETVVREHIGYLSLGSATPVSEDTIYRWFSMTKEITSTALMLLFEEGAWRFDDPLARFLPEFTGLEVAVVDERGVRLVAAEREPTMRDILLHTAGFTYGFTDNDHPVDGLYRESAILDYSVGYATFVRRLRSLPLVTQPGTVWRYSVSHDVQAAVVERISGQRFGEFVRERICAPLAMRDTSFFVEPANAHRLAGLHGHDENGALTPRPTASFPIADVSRPSALESGGAGLVGTLEDYRRFGQMLHNGGELDGVRILAPATVALMRAPLVPTLEGGLMYTPGGFNIYRDAAAAGSLCGAGTAFAGGAAGTWYWSDPHYDIIVIGMISVMPWNRGPDLGYVVEPLIYAALVDPSR
jgi:CubicO group peptidase (beta-lactamase class C family)